MRFITALKTASYIESQQNPIQKLTRYSFTSVLFQQNRVGLKVRGSDPGKGEIFHTPSTSALRPSQPHVVDIGSFPGIKRPGRGAEYPPTFGAKVNDRVLHFYSLSGGAGGGISQSV